MILLLCALALPAGASAAGDTRLIEAVKAANGQAVKTLLRDRVDVNTREADGTTALHWAVRGDDVATVQQLLEAKAAGACTRSCSRRAWRSSRCRA